MTTQALERNNTLRLVEIFGATTGMAGALLLALNNEYSKLAYPIWMLSNPLYIFFMIKNKHFPTAAKDLFFLGTTMIGIYKWWL